MVAKRTLRPRGGDGEIRTLAGFNTPTAFRERTLQPLGYISIYFQPILRRKIRYSVVWITVSILLAFARKNPPGKYRKALRRAGLWEQDGEVTVGISSADPSATWVHLRIKVFSFMEAIPTPRYLFMNIFLRIVLCHISQLLASPRLPFSRKGHTILTGLDKGGAPWRQLF